MSLDNNDFSAMMNNNGKYLTQINANASSITLSNSATSEAAAEAITGIIGNCHGADYINLEFTVDINQAQNVRVHMVGLFSLTGTEYMVPWSATQNYYECITDADMSWLASWAVNKAFPYYKFYGWMGTDGGTNPAITSSKISISAR